MLGATMEEKKKDTLENQILANLSDEIGDISPDTATFPPPPYYDFLLIETERQLAKKGGGNGK